MHFRFLLACFILELMILIPVTRAEPWLSNRYAQNCSSCHSPSRRNLVPIDRRCTLACQGCHVNPSGGGLRNEYGVWNQQRWLRSFKSDFLRNKGTPAPLKYQKYGNMPDHLTPVIGLDAPNRPSISEKHEPKKIKNAEKSAVKNKKSSSAQEKAQEKRRKPQSENPQTVSPTLAADMKKWEDMAKDGPPLVVASGVDYNPQHYDKSDRQEHILVGSRSEFLARITEDDPYRLERKKSVFAGGDFRYFYLDFKRDVSTGTDSELSTMLAMAFDLGVKVRPIPEHLALVFEHRYSQAPRPNGGQGSLEKVFYTGAQVRSAYAIVDDLPWASYMMYGLYRPQFGHYNPDHTTLLNTLMFANNANGSDAYGEVQARSATAVNKAFSIGASPNVPFVNLHLIMPTAQNFEPSLFSQDHGFAANIGGRFVTYGASFMLSWWSTKGPRGGVGEDLKNDMLGLTGGFTHNDFVVNLDYTTITREFLPGRSDSGVVSTMEVKYRFWREMYGVLNFGSANVARNLKNGRATELMYGVKTFLLPGTELEVLMVNREDRNEEDGGTTSTDGIQAQFHLFF